MACLFLENMGQSPGMLTSQTEVILLFLELKVAATGCQAPPLPCTQSRLPYPLWQQRLFFPQ